MAAPRVDPRDMAYRQMLINLDKLLTERELSAMKFQCKAVGIGDRNRAKIDSCLELFERLEERNLLGIANLSFLKELLKGCTDNRQDVFSVVSQFEKYTHADRAGTPGKPDLSKEIHFLVNNLGKEWRFFFRALGVKEATLELCMETHPRNVREQMHMAFKEWQDDHDPKKEVILRALTEIRRNDLHHMLLKGEHLD